MFKENIMQVTSSKNISPKSWFPNWDPCSQSESFFYEHGLCLSIASLVSVQNPLIFIVKKYIVWHSKILYIYVFILCDLTNHHTRLQDACLSSLVIPKYWTTACLWLKLSGKPNCPLAPFHDWLVITLFGKSLFLIDLLPLIGCNSGSQ